MSELLIRRYDNEWEVWLGLDGDGSPEVSPCGFIIGVGATRDEALADAEADLAAVLNKLRQPQPSAGVRADEIIAKAEQ